MRWRTRKPQTLGDFYLLMSGVGYLVLGILFAFNVGDLFGGVAYHVLLSVPRGAWGLMWVTCGGLLIRPLITRKVTHRRWAAVAGVHASLLWAVGCGLALVIDPRSGAGGGPIFLLMLAAMHYGVIRYVHGADERFWGRTR